MTAVLRKVVLKRVYDPAAEDDGFRVLVDRLWPRGLTKAKVGVDLWLKEVAPTTELRQWFHRDPSQWGAFQTKYRAELRGNKALTELRSLIRTHGRVTLLYGAKDPEQNHAVVLLSVLEARK